MRNRKNELINFINQCGHRGDELHEIKNDASFRNYYRLLNRDLMIMDADPKKGESVFNFKKINKILKTLGFSVPEIVAVDEENGFMLIEDFGNRVFTKLLNSENEKDLLKRAIKVLLEINKKVSENKSIIKNIEKYSIEVLIQESNLFMLWYLQKHMKVEIDDRSMKDFSKILKNIFEKISPIENSLVLRDYHVDNLFYLNERDYVKSVGIIDFQDALCGSTSYDLISILEDVRRPISSELIREMINYYIEEAFENRERIYLETEFFSIQRNLKILGIFCRLNYRDNKNHYLSMLPRSLEFIQKHIKKEPYSELNKWMSYFNMISKS